MSVKSLLSTVVLALVWCQCHAVAQDLSSIAKALRQSRDACDNCQFAWKEALRSPGKQERMVATCRFWSREGKYFRVDRTLADSPELEERRKLSRLIVRPEGYAALKGPDEDSLALINFGPADEGLNRLYAEFYYNAGIRGYFAYMEDIIGQCQTSGDCVIEKTGRDDEIRITQSMEASQSSEKTTYAYEYALDLASGVTTEWVERKKSEDAIQSVTRLMKHYEDSSVPSEIIYERKDNIDEQPTVTRKILTRTSFVSEPAPIEAFAIPGFPADAASRTSFTWVRRFLVLVFGILLLTCYFAYRKHSKSGDGTTR